jgi:hypothetical protein
MYTAQEEINGPGRWQSVDGLVPRRVRERGDDALDLEVLVYGRQPLVPAEPAHLVPAEGRVRVEGEVAVHPHGAGAHRPRHPVDDVQTLGHDAGGEPVPGAVGLLNHLINRPGRRNVQSKKRPVSTQEAWDWLPSALSSVYVWCTRTDVPELHEGHDGAEDLFLRDPHVLLLNPINPL